MTRDVLQRHQAVHEKDEARGKASLRRTKERAIEACEACATAKLSCDNERPCKVRRTVEFLNVASTNKLTAMPFKANKLCP